MNVAVIGAGTMVASIAASMALVRNEVMAGVSQLAGHQVGPAREINAKRACVV